MKILRALLILICPSLALAFPAKKEADIKPLMQKLFADISFLLPLSLEEGKLQTLQGPLQHQALAAFSRLEGNAAVLQKAARSHPDRFLEASFHDLHYFMKEARRAYQEGRYGQTQSLIQFQTEECMACHTLAASAQEPQLQLAFLSKIEFRDLNVWAKARFLTMARQFSQAMSEYERLLGSEDIPQQQIILSDALQEYLVLGLRVMGDEARVLDHLGKLAKSINQAVVQGGLKSTIANIKKVMELKKPWNLETADTLIAMGRGVKTFPVDQKGAVYFIYSSRVIRESLREKGHTPSALAKHHYLLGLSELELDSYSFKGLYYLKNAIETYPAGSNARRALDLYKKHLELAFTGSAGTHIPEKEQRRYEKLAKLVYRPGLMKLMQGAKNQG